MELYADIIKEALLFFPVLAFFVTIPYIIHNYRKFGSVLSLRILIVYSFVLYLLCAYFLVILPLPSREAVSLMTGPRLQLIPFHFAADIIKEAGSGGILSYINNPALFQMLFNVAMTIPFGMYLRYYFQWSRKKTLAASFLLSLFFELTQLSGLYFYYPRNYRLFDVDDLMANTLGGILGHYLTGPFLKVLPNRQQMDAVSFRRGREVSLARRLTAIVIDITAAVLLGGAAAVLCRICSVTIPYLSWIVCFGYFVLLPAFYGGQTFGKRLTGTKIAAVSRQNAAWYQYVVRSVSIFLGLYGIPRLIYEFLEFCARYHVITEYGTLFLSGLFAAGYCFYFVFAAVMMALHKPLFYEKISRTQVISTVRRRL